MIQHEKNYSPSGLFSKATKRKLPTSSGPTATGAGASAAADDAAEIQPKKRGRPPGTSAAAGPSPMPSSMPPPAQNAAQTNADLRLQGRDTFSTLKFYTGDPSGRLKPPVDLY